MRQCCAILLSAASFLLVSCGSGGSQTVMISVSVTPASANVAVSQQMQFNATVNGSANQSVTWSVSGGAVDGTISATGLYSAPASVPSPAQVTVTATAVANSTKTGSATVTVTPAGPNVTVAVSPSPAAVEVFKTQQFNDTVTGSTNTAVTWQVNGVTGGSASTGTISSTGLYTAPHSVPVKSVNTTSQTTTVTVTAVSNANPASSGSSLVTVTPPPGTQTPETAPVVLGTSGGNVNDKSVNGSTVTCCSGTLGALVARGGTQFILSNNHVLARSDLGVKTNGTTPGDAISQPGLVDSRCGQNTPLTVANLTDFYNLETGTGTKIDAAIAQIVPGTVDTAGNILELGATATNGIPDPGAPHQGAGVAATLNMSVAKSGRSTGLTCSTVIGVNVTVNNVSYQKGCGTGTTFTVNYTGQVMVASGAFSAEGDSGSLIVTQDTADPVALLYAGSDTDSVGNPVSAVLNFFSTAGNPMTFVGTAGTHQVIGCTGPFPLAAISATPNSLATQVSTASSEKVQQAVVVRDAHGAELMAHPEAQAIGVGASYDNPEEPAILIFVTRGAPRTGIPAEVGGIRTRLIEGDLFPARGVLSQAQSAQLEQSAGAPHLAYGVSESEVTRAMAVHAARVDEWIHKAGVQAVGVTSSVDAPGESALLIYLVRGQEHEPIPAVIDGLRTRVRIGSPFKAGLDNVGPGGSCKVAKAAEARTTQAGVKQAHSAEESSLNRNKSFGTAGAPRRLNLRRTAGAG